MSETMSPRAARSRERLLRAATGLLVDTGPRGVTVDAVAEASGVAKSTLYRHWPSRDELLVDVVRGNVPDVVEPDLDQGFERALRGYIDGVAVALGDPDWSCIVPALMSLRNTMPELAAIVEQDRCSKTELLGGILALGVAEGALPAEIDVDDSVHLLIGPIVLASLTGATDRLEHLATAAVDRFIASYRGAS